MVLDASAAVELLLNTPAGDRISSRLEDETEVIHAPHLIDIEIAQVLRRHVLHGLLEDARVGRTLDRWRDLDIERYAHAPLLDRVWQLRHNVRAYDAV
ncbi:MAG: type II toxin-antitoxin system VapC family toxin [Spirochaetaceae bacterium]|nr:type II toxin-antitoxin system VapC family toxin [Spirochaetaceae bacterium]